MNQTVEKLTVGSGPELFFQIKQINSDKKERDGGGDAIEGRGGVCTNSEGLLGGRGAET